MFLSSQAAEIVAMPGKKLMQSLYRPEQGLRVPGMLRLSDFKTIGT